MIANIPQRCIIFKDKEREQFKKETRCWICKGEFDDKDKNKKKVKDHCHFTGRYRGAAHNNSDRERIYFNETLSPVFENQ